MKRLAALSTATLIMLGSAFGTVRAQNIIAGPAVAKQRLITTVTPGEPALRLSVLDMDSSESSTHGEQEARPGTATSTAPTITSCSCATNTATGGGCLLHRVTPT